MSCDRAHQTPIETLLAAPDTPECAEFLAHAEGCPECRAALSAHRSRTHRSGSRGLVVGLAVGAVALALLALWPRGGDEAAPAPPADEPPAGEAPAGPPPAAAVPPAPPEARFEAVADLVSNEHRTIALADVPVGEPLRLNLRLAEPSANDEPRPVRVTAVSGETLEISGSVKADRTSAAIEIPRSFAIPGRYMIEVRTTEQTHFPARRYVIELQ